jgi:transcriptional regulator with XRE-family HTH domain
MADERAAEAKRIGRVIAQLRMARGWSQQDLAGEIDVGVSTVSRWERGLHEGYGSNVRKLAKALKVAPAVLRPVEPDTEGQLDRIEAKLDDLIALLTPGGAQRDTVVAPAGAPLLEQVEPQTPPARRRSATPRPGRRPRSA